MQTVKLELEDTLYQDMIKSGIDIQGELQRIIKKTIYHKEYKIANEINQGIEEVNAGKSKPIENLFSEL